MSIYLPYRSIKAVSFFCEKPTAPTYLISAIAAPIFVELDETAKTGYIFHVKGHVQNGMTYESKLGRKPEEFHIFVSKTAIG